MSATLVQFGLGAILPHSNTPSLRVAGFEDEDDDEDEYEAPCEGRAQEQRPLSPLVPIPFSVGLRPLSVLPNHLHQAQRILRRPAINIVVEIDKPS
jgi:hypothetical protein